MIQTKKLNHIYKMNKKFTLTKRIAKHGNQSIIVIPGLIEEHLKPGTVVEINIQVLFDKE